MFKERIEELEEMGLKFIFKYDSYCFKDVNVGVDEIQTMSDIKWYELIEEIKPVIKARKLTHKEQFITGLTKARGFCLEDAELIYTKFKESDAVETTRGDHDAEDFVRNSTKPLIEEQTKILEKAINEAKKAFESNLGLSNVEVDMPLLTIPDAFLIFKNKILPSYRVQ